MTTSTQAPATPGVSPHAWPLWLRGLIVFLPGLLWWIAFFPGNLTYDSIGSIGQIISGDYWNNHPVAYTLFVQGMTLDLRAIWLLTLVQSLGLAWALYLTGRSIGAGPNLASIAAAIVMVTPYGGPFAVTVWKDVPFTILTLLGVVVVLKAARGRRRWLWLAAVALLGVGSSFRHNGWPMLVLAAFLLLVLLLLVHRAREGRAVVVVLLVAALVSVGIQQTAVAATKARPLDPWFTYQTILADLAYAAAWHPEQMPDGLVDFVGEFAQGKALEGAKDCTVINALIYGDGFNEQVANQVLPEALSWYLKVAKTTPQYLAQARLCRGAAFLPPPLSFGPKFVYQNELSVFPNDWGISQREPVPWLTNAARALDGVWVSAGRVLAWPGLLGLLGTVALVLPYRRRANWLVVPRLTWVALIWGSLVTLAVVSVSQDFRYGAVPAFVSLVFVVVALGQLVARRRSRTSA